jgi:putative glutamine amidotransferase
MKNKPKIGITGPAYGGISAFFFTSIAVILAGGRPEILTPSKKINKFDFNGIILGGGSDIDPLIYKKDPKDFFISISDFESETKVKKKKRILYYLFFQLLILFRWVFSTKKRFKIDKKRDQAEYLILKKAIEKNIPVLGICRGAQLINVFFKGTLYPDTLEFYEEYPRIRTILPKKDVNVVKNSKLFKILEQENLSVNSLHHQSVAKKGENIKISAKEPNNVVQGIEHEKMEFVLGVQWHPEYLFYDKFQRNLFIELVKKAKRA